MVPLEERTGQLLWVLDHLDDLDADFLACYGIDLHDCDLAGPRFFALAHRVLAFGGVMSARAETEREEQDGPRPSPTQPAPTSSSGSGKEVTLTAFRVMFPGIVSSSEAGHGG